MPELPTHNPKHPQPTPARLARRRWRLIPRRPRRILLLLLLTLCTTYTTARLSYLHKDRISAEVSWYSYTFSPAHRVPPYVPPSPVSQEHVHVPRTPVTPGMRDPLGYRSETPHAVHGSQSPAILQPLHHSAEHPLLPDDLRGIRRALLGGAAGRRAAKESGWWREFRTPENTILRDKWYRFGGAPLWLPQEGCYIVFTRVSYSRVGRRNRPHLSVIRGQAFDAEWNELHGKHVAYGDARAGSQGPDSGVTYPAFFEVPFDVESDWNGPEDPHVVAVAGEPVLVFNMFSQSHGRGMYLLRPHRQLQPLTRLQLPSTLLPRTLEKNWTPLHHPIDDGPGTLRFVYSFAPLRVLRCGIDSGACALVFAGSASPTDARAEDVRGGTQFVQLPSRGSESDHRERLWVAFPKLHTVVCGCGGQYYRPMLTVMQETPDGSYALRFLVPTLTFGIDVLAWDLQGSHCDMINVLSPNSIAQWTVEGDDDEDYLTLAVSEADVQTRIVVLRGLRKYITAVLHSGSTDSSPTDSGSTDSSPTDSSPGMFEAALDDAELQCAAYGHMHGAA